MTAQLPPDAGRFVAVAGARKELRDARTRWISARHHRRLIDDVLAKRSIQMVFQPIVEAETLRTLGYEALSRFATKEYATTDQWFAAAHVVQRGIALEFLAIEKALAGAANLPPDVYLAINVGPDAMLDRQLLPMLLESEFPSNRIVLELTEHTPFGDDISLVRARRALATHGIRLAIDDVGAGYSSLRHVIALAPEIAKLDQSITVGIDHDPARQALVAAVIMFAKSQGLTVIAEGVETNEQRDALASLGVDQLQGHAIGVPLALKPTTEKTRG